MQKTEVVRLRRVAKTEGATIPKESYDMLSGFIIDTLTYNSNPFVTLNELLERAELELVHAIPRDMLWYLLQVKNDLEAREIITVVVDSNRVQRVRLAKKKVLRVIDAL